MITPFSLNPVPKIIFGKDSLDQLAQNALSYGHHILLVLGGETFSKSRIYEKLISDFDTHKITYKTVHIAGEPSPESINQIVENTPAPSFDLVVAIGGGSVLDAGKAISAMLVEQQDITDFLEGVGSQKPSGRKLPFIAVPTTSGTGSEATANSVISSVGASGFKKSLRHSNYVPELALIDPRLTVSCPPKLTACCGMDSFTQLVEAYLSTNSSPITDALCLTGIQAIQRSLYAAFIDGENITARADLSYAALLSGIVLASAGLGTVHGFASVIGGFFPAPHGAVCGILMRPCNEMTLKRLRENDSGSIALEKYARLGGLFGEKFNESKSWYQDFFLDTLQDFTEKLHLPPLGEYGLKQENISEIAALTGNKYNPVNLNNTDLAEICSRAL
jgi:alcohol dehydrogenase class IV